MKDSILYKTIKHVTDRVARYVSQVVPDLAASETVEAVPAVGPFRSTLPRNFTQLAPAFAVFFEETVTLPAVHIFTLRRVKVSWHTLVFNHLRIFKPALASAGEREHFLDSYLFKHWIGKPVPTAGQPLALVHNQWTRDNYYHWMIDSLCRLLVLRQRFPQARLLMPEPLPAYVHASAGLLGFHDYVSIQPHETVNAPLLVVPEHVTPNGLHHPELLPQLRVALMSKFWNGKELPTPTRRVYVSRSKQKVRRLRNEDAVQALFARQGFETIYFEGLTLEQQVQLMAEVKVLIGVHGANLTNLIFLQKGASVVELMNEEKFFALGNSDFENLNYYRMCSCLELPYYSLPCQNVPDQLPSNSSDVLVSIDELERVLRHF